MNITLKNIDSVNAIITISVVKEDYQPQVKKAMNDIRKTLVLDGFRKGNAPMLRIQALYGKSVMVDEINKLVSDKLLDYIKKSGLNVFGEPIPSNEEQKPLDFGKQEDYEFNFDIGLAPEINANLTKDDKLPYYNITATDDMIEEQIKAIKANYGTYEKDIEEIEDRDVVKGILTELDEEGNEKEDGLTNSEAFLTPFFFKNKEEREKFLSAKVGDAVIFNPHKAYEGHETELSSFLKIKKEEVKNYPGDFSFAITEITRYKEAELNQELFDKIFAPGTVESEEVFKEKIKEDIAIQMIPQSDYKFLFDIKKLWQEKVKDVRFPDAFLKRWLLESDPKRTKESIEIDYPNIIEGAKYSLIKDKSLKENNIEITKEEVQDYAVDITRSNFARYGMGNISDQLLQEYAQKMLDKEDSVRSLVDKITEEKLIAIWKEQVTLDFKEITKEEFQKLLETPSVDENKIN
jgi:trigger factor